MPVHPERYPRPSQDGGDVRGRRPHSLWLQSKPAVVVLTKCPKRTDPVARERGPENARVATVLREVSTRKRTQAEVAARSQTMHRSASSPGTTNCST